MNFSKYRPMALVMWMIGSIFYAYQYILRVMPSIMLNDITQQFDLDSAAFGQFSGVYYIGYSLMHLPIGIMLDRFGPKKIMSGCVLLTVIGMLPLIFTNHWAYAMIGRVLVGIGSSGAILGIFKIIRLSFSEKLFPRMLSISVTIGLLGAIYGGGPVEYMKGMLGFYGVVKVFALLGIVLAIATYCIIPATKASCKNTIFSDIKEVLGNKKVILACIFAGFMVGPLEGFADVWGAVFFKQVQGFNGILAASLPSMIFIGMCFGSPILNLIGERSRNYLMTIVGAGLLMATGFVFLLFGQWRAEIISIVLLFIGIACAYQILAIYKISTYVRSNVAGFATATANMIIMIFGYLFHGIIGVIINRSGGTCNSKALTYGMSTIPVALCIGVIGFVYLHIKEKSARPKYCKRKLRLYK